MSTAIVFQQMLIIFIMILLGYLAYKKGFVQGDASRGISALVVNICNPAILIRSAFNRDPAVTTDKILLAVLGGAVVYGILFVVSILLPKIIHAGEKWSSHYSLLCMFGNTGFIGIPLASAVLGSQALIYVAVVNGYFNLFFYTYGIRLADGKSGKFQWKSMLNVGNVTIFLTVLIFVWQPALPALVTNTVDYVANATTFLAMVVMGIALARTNLLEILSKGKMYLFIGLRFLIVPIGISLILRLFIHDELVYGALVLMTCVPAANLPLMRVEEVGGDGQVLSAGIIMSTVLSLVTIPLVAMFV